MGETTANYPGDAEGDNVWTRRDLVRRYHHGRQRDLAVATMLLELARCIAKHEPRRTGRVCGLCLRAAEWFQFAGMSRQGDAAWRYARFAHRAAGRAA